jgi:CheY-like chemotaxis protein
LLGGDISVNSQPNCGSTFTFDILATAIAAPCAHPVEIITEPIAGLVPGQPSYRILIVEDRATNRLLLLNLLKPLGFQIREAENGVEALKLWRDWQPDLIWMDMQMPLMDGYEATRQIRAREWERRESISLGSLPASTKIIALTASAFEEQRQAILAVGCDDFVRKPFQQQELLAKLSQHLGVQYVYEKSTSAAIAPTAKLDPNLNELPAAIAAMPPEWTLHLYQTAAQGNDVVALQLLEQLPDEYGDLKRELQNLISNFQFERLMELIQPTPAMALENSVN